jgi:hypothetical protein
MQLTCLQGLTKMDSLRMQDIRETTPDRLAKLRHRRGARGHEMPKGQIGDSQLHTVSNGSASMGLVGSKGEADSPDQPLPPMTEGRVAP